MANETASLSLVTLTTAKTYLKVSNTSANAEITSLVLRVSHLLQLSCNRIFKLNRYSERLDGDGSSSIVMIKNPPIIAVQIYDDVTRAFASTSLIATSGYYFNAEAGIIELDSGVFAKGVGNIKINYTGGFSTTAMANSHADIEHMVLLWTAREYKRWDERIHGTEVINRGDSSESISIGKMPDEVEEIVSLYRMTP